MLKMTLEELYEVGENFESFVGNGTKNERARFPKNYSRIDINREIVERVGAIDKAIKFLCVGEVWCPDCQLNLTVIKKMMEINSKLDMSIITLGRGRKFLREKLEIEELKVPTVVVLDGEYNILGTFVEAPESFKVLPETDENELKYMKGGHLINTINEFCEIIEKN